MNLVLRGLVPSYTMEEKERNTLYHLVGLPFHLATTWISSFLLVIILPSLVQCGKISPYYISYLLIACVMLMMTLMTKTW